MELTRKGPGILLRDLLRGEDRQINAVLGILELADVDILLLQGFDYDLTGEALGRFARSAGYPHWLSIAPNSGRQTGLDVDADGRLGEPEDALGFGRFFGEGGMALLSRFPFGDAQHFNDLIWRDFNGALLPDPNAVWPSAAVHAALPLASVGHWLVPVTLPEAQLTLMAFHAAPPVFDGPEDRNGRRNHDQIVFWHHLLETDPPDAPFVLIGDANLDPAQGDGRKSAIRALLDDSRLQDPHPRGAAGMATVDWTDIDVGRLRVSYILPGAGLDIREAGVFWPDNADPIAELAARASRHRLVWVDLRIEAP